MNRLTVCPVSLKKIANLVIPAPPRTDFSDVVNTGTEVAVYIRRCALDYSVPYFTTIAGAEAAAEGIVYLQKHDFDVKPLQEYDTPVLP